MAITFIAAIAGVLVVSGSCSPRCTRWVQREFLHSRWLIVALTAIGGALAGGGTIRIVAPRLGGTVILVACVSGVILLLIAPYFRRTPGVLLRPRRILAVGAHPDDLELACGATLAKLADEGHIVETVVLSAGGGGGHALVRAAEAQHSSHYLRAAVSRLFNFEDTILAASARDMVRVLEAAIEEFRPDIILTHSSHDQHQDHEAVHRATMRAARHSPSILCYESPSATRDFSPDLFVDVSDYVDIKLRSVELHRDQRGKPYMDGAQLRATARFRGRQARTGAAEGFEVVRLSASSLGEI